MGRFNHHSPNLRTTHCNSLWNKTGSRPIPPSRGRCLLDVIYLTVWCVMLLPRMGITEGRGHAEKTEYDIAVAKEANRDSNTVATQSDYYPMPVSWQRTYNRCSRLHHRLIIAGSSLDSNFLKGRHYYCTVYRCQVREASDPDRELSCLPLKQEGAHELAHFGHQNCRGRRCFWFVLIILLESVPHEECLS